MDLFSYIFNKEHFKTHRNYLIVITAIIVFFLFRECGHKASENNLLSRATNYQTRAKVFENKYHQEVSYNGVLKFNTTKQLKQYGLFNDTIRDMLKKFSAIASVVTLKQKVYIHDTVPFPVDKIIPCDFTPFTISKTKPEYGFLATISNKDVVIDSLTIPNQQTIVVGEKKTGFLNLKREWQVEVTNSNPLIKTPELGAYTIKQSKKWYQRPLVTFGIGVMVGGVTFLSVKK